MLAIDIISMNEIYLKKSTKKTVVVSEELSTQVKEDVTPFEIDIEVKEETDIEVKEEPKPKKKVTGKKKGTKK